jgi:two-component system, NarL family, nitrate/nitrite response regulator NarL
MQPPTTILIADDHPIVLDGLAALFQAAGHSVIARCMSGIEVFEALQRVAPDVIILDLNMPAPNGIEIVRQLKGTAHPAKIVLLTSHLDDGQIVEAIRLGVDGIVLKETPPQQLITCLDSVQAGRQWFDSAIAARALNMVGSLASRKQRADQLTARETDVVRLVARGLRNKEVARALTITEGTVKMYLHSIYEKLNVASRVELTNAARQHELL